MPVNEQYLYAQIRNMDTRLLRLQRDFERLRGIQQGAEVEFDRKIYTGDGLVGGGDLSQNRTLSVNIKPYVSSGSASGLAFDNGQLYVKIGTGLAYSNGAIIATGGGGGGTTVNAGNGLSFGQDGTTLNVNVSGLIALQNDNVVLSNGTAKNQVIATYTDNNNQTVHGWRDLSNYAGKGLVFNGTDNQFDVQGGYGIVSYDNNIEIDFSFFNENKGFGFDIVGNTYKVKVVAGNGIIVDDIGVRIAPSIAGQGLTWNSQVSPQRLDIVAGDGLGWNNLTNGIDVKIQDVNTGSSATNANFGLHLANDTVNLGYSSEPKTSSQILATLNGLLTLSNLTVQQTAVGSTGTGIFKVQSQLSEGANTANPVFIVDAYNRQVGINKPPDPQFDLDVNGALRATYLIGRHALQVEKLTMISHFDGASEDGVFGEPNGHMNQIGSRTGVVFFYRQPTAKFSKAVGMAMNTTNLVTNPSFEYNNNGVAPSGWTYSGTGGSALTDITRYWVGSKSVKITSGTSANSILFANNFYSGTAPAAGTVFWAQARIYRTNPLKGVSLTIRRGGTDIATTTVNLPVDNSDGGGEWEWLYTSYTVQAGDTATQYGITINNLAADGTAIWVDAVQFENNTFNPYFDGSFGGYNNEARIFPTTNNNTGAYWTGTANLSISSTGLTNIATRISYNTNRTGMITSVGSAFVWIYPTDLNTGVSGFQFFHIFRSTSNASFRIFISPTGVITLNFLGQTFTTSALGASIFLNKWSFVTLTWSGTNINLYLNAEKIATFTLTAPTLTEFDSNLSLGPGRGFFDELGIVQRELPAKEILSIYQSNAPVFAESSIFNFRPTPNGLVWADERGLWVQQQSGKAAFGIYGGTDATYTWGGILLNQGDVLIGESPNYMRFQPDVGKLTINAQKQSGTGSGTGFVLDSEEGISIQIPSITQNQNLGINSFSFVENNQIVSSISQWQTIDVQNNKSRVLRISTINNPASSPNLNTQAQNIEIAPGENNVLKLITTKGGSSDYISMTPSQTTTSTGDNEIYVRSFGNVKIQAGGTFTSIINLLSVGDGEFYHGTQKSIYLGQQDLSATQKVRIFTESDPAFPTTPLRPKININRGLITSSKNVFSSGSGFAPGIEVGYAFLGSSSNFNPTITGFFMGHVEATTVGSVLLAANWDSTQGIPGTFTIRSNISRFQARPLNDLPLQVGITLTGGAASSFSQIDINRPMIFDPTLMRPAGDSVPVPAYPFVRMYIKRSTNTGNALLIFAFMQNANNQGQSRYYGMDLTTLAGNTSTEPN